MRSSGGRRELLSWRFGMRNNGEVSRALELQAWADFCHSAPVERHETPGQPLGGPKAISYQFMQDCSHRASIKDIRVILRDFFTTVKAVAGN